MNKVILIGNLTKDPELRYTPNGVAVATFTVAVQRQHNRDEADFINCVAWQKLADLVATYLRKGRPCAVEGRLQTRSYDNKEGKKVYVTEVVAENVQFLGGRQGGGQNMDNWNFDPITGTPIDRPQGGGDPFGDPFADTGRPINISDDDLPF